MTNETAEDDGKWKPEPIPDPFMRYYGGEGWFGLSIWAVYLLGMLPILGWLIWWLGTIFLGGFSWFNAVRCIFLALSPPEEAGYEDVNIGSWIMYPLRKAIVNDLFGFFGWFAVLIPFWNLYAMPFYALINWYNWIG